MATFGGNFMCTSFKQQLLQGCHDFTLTTGDVFKLALYSDAAGVTFNATTTAYTATTEVANSGTYAAGGGTLTNISPTIAASPTTTAITDFADLSFTSATINARGALIYNTTPNTTSSAGLTNPTVAVLDFGSIS